MIKEKGISHPDVPEPSELKEWLVANMNGGQIDVFGPPKNVENLKHGEQLSWAYRF